MEFTLACIFPIATFSFSASAAAVAAEASPIPARVPQPVYKKSKLSVRV